MAPPAHAPHADDSHPPPGTTPRTRAPESTPLSAMAPPAAALGDPAGHAASAALSHTPLSRAVGGHISLDRALCVRLTGFVSLLRENGFAVGVDDATLLVEAASRIGVLDPLVLGWTAQALLCRRAADQQRFADLFDSWFLPPNRRKHVESRGGGVGALEHGDGARMGREDDSEGTPVTAPDGAMSPAPKQATPPNGVPAPTKHWHKPISDICISPRRCAPSTN